MERETGRESKYELRLSTLGSGQKNICERFLEDCQSTPKYSLQELLLLDGCEVF